MPNGKHNAQCSNCDFFRGHVLLETRPESRRWCYKHDFVMPYGCGELICADWQHGNEKSESSSLLERGLLYYYSYASLSPPEKLRDFQSLQNLIFSINIHQDDEFGWVLYVKKEAYPWFPGPDERLSMRLGEAENLFQVVDVQRKLWVGSKRTPSGNWREKYRTRSQRVVYCPEFPESLYEWLGMHIDVKRLVAEAEKHRQTEMLLPLGIFTFAELVEEYSLYMLYPDLLHYKEYRRN